MKIMGGGSEFWRWWYCYQKKLFWYIFFCNIILNHVLILFQLKAPNGKIIVYGGTTSSNIPTPPIQVTAVLNTETEPFEWTAPLVSSNVGKVPSLTSHTANLVDNYMIVTFGK